MVRPPPAAARAGGPPAADLALVPGVLPGGPLASIGGTSR